MFRSRRTWAVLAAGTLVLRLPAFFASRHLSFDDGVYGASALAMRDGAVPFRDVFSSQGPLFLPLVWLADLAGLRTLNAPRLLALAAAAVLVVAVWATARLAGCGSRAAAVGAALVATSGSVWWVTGPLTSDGPALALATTAVALALAWRRMPVLATAVLCGVAMGAALSVKSLLVAAAAPVGLVLLRRPRHLGAAVAAAVAVGLVTTLPWGFSEVWDQSVTYHLEAADQRTPGANAAKIVSTLGDRDLPLLAAGAVAAAAAVGRRRRRPAGWDSAALPLALWLGATLLVLLLEHPLWRNHLAHLVVPAALAVAVILDRFGTRPFRRTLAAVVLVSVVVVPYHLVHIHELLWPSPPRGRVAAARAALEALPPGAWAISDEPGLVWRTGRRTPADLVDTSVLRIESGRITTASVAEEAADPRVCAVLVWSSRFGRLDLGPHLAGYREVARFGGPKVLYVKDSC